MASMHDCAAHVHGRLVWLGRDTTAIFCAQGPCPGCGVPTARLVFADAGADDWDVFVPVDSEDLFELDADGRGIRGVHCCAGAGIGVSLEAIDAGTV
jgi:hypothetical protein